jgi:hypothetical protein
VDSDLPDDLLRTEVAVTGPLTAGRETRDVVLLWSAFFAGPAAWIVYQGLGYVAVKPVCAGASSSVLWLITATALAIVGAGASTAWRYISRLRTAASPDGGSVADRSHFLAVVAMAFNGLIALLIVAAAIPQFVLSPCE